VGTKTRTLALERTKRVVVMFWPMPYDTLSNCSGKAGANSDAMVTPSGCTSARYSPLALKLKLVCNGAPATLRFLPEAKTRRKSFCSKVVAGKLHLVKSAASSVRYQPPRFTAVPPEL